MCPFFFAEKMSDSKHSKVKVAVVVDGANLHFALKQCMPPLKEKDIDWGIFLTI